MSAFVADAIRTPRGRGNARGMLADRTPVELLAELTRALLDRNRLDPDRIDEAFVGCVTQTGPQGANVGRAAMLEAGVRAPAMTIQRFCASSLSGARLAADLAATRDALLLSAGVEMLSRAPLGSDAGPLGDRDYQLAHGLVPIGISADAIATQAGISRQECDAYAAESQRRAARARREGRFRSIVAVRSQIVADETIREETTEASLAALAPAFVELGAAGFDAIACKHLGLASIDHVHTAGNSPATADGASAVLIGSKSAIERAGLTPRARIAASIELSGDPVRALDATVEATRRVLEIARIPARSIDVFEVNEAFAGPSIYYCRALGLDPAAVDPNGGAIALGHPMGATGGMLIGMALDELERTSGRYALVAIAGATGLACALVLDRSG